MKRIAFVMDAIESLNLKKDSTIAMIRAAQVRGWEVTYLRQRDLLWHEGTPQAYARRLTVVPEFMTDSDSDSEFSGQWWQVGPEQRENLTDFDVVMMRKDPPFDMEYIYSTYVLDSAVQAGTLIVNRPQSLRDCNEKYFTTRFSELMPPTIVSQRADALREFHAQHDDVIFKKLDGMGGMSVFRVRTDDPNLNVVIETLTDNGRSPIMGQKFVPEISKGDKRILLVDGNPIPYALARIPMIGETRGNLAAGATGVAQPLTDRDWHIANAIGDELRARGLMFVGIDVIGDYLTEVNVTCPTCIRELDLAFDLDIAGSLLDTIESRLS